MQILTSSLQNHGWTTVQDAIHQSYFTIGNMYMCQLCECNQKLQNELSPCAWSPPHSVLHDFVFCKWHIIQQAQTNAANSCCQPCLRLKDTFQAIQGCCHAYICLLSWSLIFLLQSTCNVQKLCRTHNTRNSKVHEKMCTYVENDSSSRCTDIPKRPVDDAGTEIISHYLQNSHAADVHASLSGMRNSIHQCFDVSKA